MAGISSDDGFRDTEFPRRDDALGVLAERAYFDVDRFSESFIEIRDRKSRELVTAIELLSPSNKKPGSDRQHYEGKRSRILASPAHFVESIC